MSVLAALILAIQLASVVRHGGASKFVEVSSLVTVFGSKFTVLMTLLVTTDAFKVTF